MQRELVVTDREVIRAVDAAKQWITHSIGDALADLGVEVDGRDAYEIAPYVFDEIRYHLEDLVRGD